MELNELPLNLCEPMKRKMRNEFAVDINSILPSQVNRKLTTYSVNWDSLLLLIDLKDAHSQFNSLVVDRVSGFTLVKQTTNVLMKELWKDNRLSLTKIKMLAAYCKIKRSIPYVRKDVQLLRLKSIDHCKRNTSWIAYHNLHHVIRMGDNRLEIYFNDLATPIYIDGNYSFIKKQEETSYQIRSMEEMICNQVNSLFGYQKNCHFNYQSPDKDDCFTDLMKLIK
ncbi:hypothetical protein IV37_GL000700 [Fructilactobacillus fructivorans]|uniref:hypothetical protein n=1 Tax=Fructilactobacillus fructivorans TaxID=1614 RepID=UPI000704F68B|nr:hypothetical protein [Fructilactobacillus fructivorans]KRN13062.1 hypothetical protein IV37_GL000700 [Fructilactobacillus fructivorans]